MKNKKTLVLGASTKPDRYAFKAITMLVEKGHSVLAIGQNAGEVAGIKIQTKAIPLKNIDLAATVLVVYWSFSYLPHGDFLDLCLLLKI